jgi:putative ABC transport system substrate-binding protein
VKRRDFITLLGGAAAAWPFAARAQQRERMRRIGVLMSFAADDPSAPPLVSAFAQGLQERGWVVGGNVRIDYRWGASDLDRFRKNRREFITLLGGAAAPRYDHVSHSRNALPWRSGCYFAST